ncbi:hypothetical protein ACP70R_039789 [Stipagrostis hirtigluma subsp. patula]
MRLHKDVESSSGSSNFSHVSNGDDKESNVISSPLPTSRSLSLMPFIAGKDDCWDVNHDYYVCLKTAKCRSNCQEHGNVDGRCNGSFPYLVPLCECLRPNCPPQAPSPSPSPLDALPQAK